MEKHEEVEIIWGIAFVWVIITSIFGLLNYLSLLMIREINIISFLFNSSIYWIIVVAGILISLFVSANKFNLEISLKILNNKVVRLSSGLLIAIEAIVTFASTLPTRIMSINTAVLASNQVGQTVNGMVAQSIISNTVGIVITLCQLALGVYLIKFYKEI